MARMGQRVKMALRATQACRDPAAPGQPADMAEGQAVMEPATEAEAGAEDPA